MNAPLLAEVREIRERMGARVRRTPLWEWQGRRLAESMGTAGQVLLKLELFQFAGSFKVRGALSNMFDMSDAEKARGVTAVSAGNHAMAVGYAAQTLGVSAKVVMPTTANPARVAGCKAFGAEVVQVEGLHNLFDAVKQIEQQEGRTFVHPFDGPKTVRGSATLGLELGEDAADLDAVIVPIGGGGLMAGVAWAIKQLQPNCRVIGVEPEGAALMHRSFESGKPEKLDEMNTIADSLGAPFTAQYSLDLCRRHVDELVLVNDDQLCAAMELLFSEAKLVTEPAGAASTAALVGPLAESLRGRRVAAVVCGSNIDAAGFCEYLSRASAPV